MKVSACRGWIPSNRAIPKTGVVVLAVLLAACGGGSGGGDRQPPDPTPAGAGNPNGVGAAQACPVVDESTPNARVACGGTEDSICVGNFDGAHVTDMVRIGAGGWPSWSPDGNQLAFQRSAAIYVANSDGAGERWLAAGTQPAWSPDGSLIAFTNDDGIAAVPVDGGDIVTIVRNDTLGSGITGAYAPEWSADGGKIAFGAWRFLLDELFGIVFVANDDGSNLQQFYAGSDSRSAQTGFPAWSPTDDRIAMASAGAIGIISTSRNEIRWLARDIVDVSRLAWSPTADSIAYKANQSCGPTSTLHLEDVDSGNVAVLVKHATEAAWSPDGTRIAFVVAGSGGTATTADFRPVTQTAETYTIEKPDSFGNVSRYIIYDTGLFELQYSTLKFGFLRYPGRYSRSGSRIDFDFDGWSTAGPWQATGTIDGDRLTVEYNTVMMLSDFEDAVYLLDRD